VGVADEYVELYREYLPRVLNYVRLRVDGEDLAQDLTAQVFERAVARQATLRRREAFGGWVFRIARNCVAEYYRRRRPSLPLEEAAGQAAPDPAPAEAVMREEELSCLRAAVAGLPEREQEVIRLRFGAGLGNVEVGEAMGLRPGHVAVILFRALRRLRVVLGAGEEDNSELGMERRARAEGRRSG